MLPGSGMYRDFSCSSKTLKPPKQVQPMSAAESYEIPVNKVLEKGAIRLFISQLQQRILHLSADAVFALHPAYSA